MVQKLEDAILFGTMQEVQQCMTPHTELNTYDDFGYTPLIEAIIADKADMVNFFLQKGADPNYRDTVSRTPLHWAVDSRDKTLAKLLLKKGADPNAYTRYSQPVMVSPWLAQDASMVKLLHQHGGDIEFAKDYINAKLLAHRFTLKGKIDLVSANQKFVELNLEGFVLASSVAMITYSLKEFIHHFSGRKYRNILPKCKQMLKAFENTKTLLSFQHHNIDPSQHIKKINPLLNNNVLILPVAYHGHAVCFAKVGNILAKCDRGEYGREYGSLRLYSIGKRQSFNFGLIQKLFYKTTTKRYVHSLVTKELGLEELQQLPMPEQLTGNCSWANVEGIIPAVLFMLLSQDARYSLETCENIAFDFFHDWQAFDRTRALDDMIASFQTADLPRKASIASLLACILFQHCRYHVQKDFAVAEKIAQVFQDTRFHYILHAYLKIHGKRQTEGGQNFAELLDILGIDPVKQ